LELSKEFKVGAFTIIALVTFFFGYNYLKGTDFFNASKRYYLVFENIDGLAQASDVILNGLPVGKVGDRTMMDDGSNRIKVTIVVQKNVRITKGSYAVLFDNGLLGGKALKLELVSGNDAYEGGDFIPTKVDGGITKQFTDNAKPILAKVDSALYKFNRIIDEKTDTAIQNILSNLEATSLSLNTLIKNADPKLQATLGNISSLSASLVQTERKLKPILEKMNGVADSLQKANIAQTVGNANKAITELHQVLAKVNNGEGSLGKLVNSDSLHNSLNTTVKDLDKLFLDIQEHPKRYIHFSVFGRKEK
jgi:phospholipid/cholesterol/gamma-HCH transport system substrate-binding protein